MWMDGPVNSICIAGERGGMQMDQICIVLSVIEADLK